MKGIYVNTRQPIKLLDDMMSQVGKMQELQMDIKGNRNEVEEQINNLRQALCGMGFIFQIKQFIADNDK